MNKLYQPHIILGAVMVLALFGCSSGGKFLGSTTFFFWNDYALYINHPKHGVFVVDDEAVLKAHRHTVKIQRKKGFANFLPTAFDRGYGLTLFKNGKPVKTYTHDRDNFEFFEIGNLAQYGKPAKFQAFSGNKAQVQAKLKELRKQKNVYIRNIPAFEPDRREHKLILITPSIAIPTKPKEQGSPLSIPVETDRFNEGDWEREWKTQWEQKIEQRIRKMTAPINSYELRIDFTKTPTQILQDYTNKALLKHGRGKNMQTPDGEPLKIPYRFYTPEIRISATSKLIRQLKDLDYSALITEEERNKPQLLQAMQEVIDQSQTPDLSIEKGDVGLWGYYDSFHIQGFGETQYELYWMEVIEGNKKTYYGITYQKTVKK